MHALKENKDNMKKNSASKGLLLKWLLNALDGKLYKGMYWVDTESRIFCIVWTHKSAEQWTNEDDEPFIAWAEFKGKRKGKNSKQLKATFRCALNSKKDHLKELPRKKNRRYWQFIDPESKEKGVTTKKTRKAKGTRGIDRSYVASSDDSTDKTYYSTSSSSLLGVSSSSEEILASPRLPNFESFCNVASLKPPHQANEISFSFSESELPQNNPNNKDNYTSTRNQLDRTSSNVFGKSSPSVRNIDEAGNSRTAMLPPFCSFTSITPPPQMTDIYLNFTECRAICTPSPDRSNLTPPLKDVQSTTSLFNSFHHTSKDIWQPNGWTTSLAHQDINNANQLIANDYDELYSSTVHETNHNRMDFGEMDQFVPVMDIPQNVQPVFRNEHFTCTNKTAVESNIYAEKRLEDDLLGDDLNLETWTIMQELNQFLLKSDNELFSYSS